MVWGGSFVIIIVNDLMTALHFGFAILVSKIPYLVQNSFFSPLITIFPKIVLVQKYYSLLLSSVLLFKISFMFLPKVKTDLIQKMDCYLILTFFFFLLFNITLSSM